MKYHSVTYLPFFKSHPDLKWFFVAKCLAFLGTDIAVTKY